MSRLAKPGVILFAVIAALGIIWFIRILTPSAPPVNGGEGGPATHYGAYVVRLVVVTVLLVGGLLLFARWYQNSRLLTSRQGLAVQVLGRAYLGTKQQLALVQVLDRFWLMGLTDQSVNLIREFSSEEIPDHLRQGSGSGDLPFAGWISKFMQTNKT